jgi:hypothetical protein
VFIFGRTPMAGAHRQRVEMVGCFCHDFSPRKTREGDWNMLGNCDHPL